MSSDGGHWAGRLETDLGYARRSNEDIARNCHCQPIHGVVLVTTLPMIFGAQSNHYVRCQSRREAYRRWN